MTQETDFFPIQGGLNLITPPIVMPPGHTIAGVNYEPAERGIRRIDGYERYDGQPQPSVASYWILFFENGTAAVAVGNVLEGATSGATARVLVAPVLQSGSYGGGTAAGYVVITAQDGTFLAAEAVEVAAVAKFDAVAAATSRGAGNDTDDTTWLIAAIEEARSMIDVVPGSGSVRGVWAFEDEVYAFRDNAGATAGGMWRATAAGWVAVALGSTLEFTLGTAEPSEGATITSGGGGTAIVRRVVVTSGDFTTSDAVGYIVVDTVAGSWTASIFTGGGGSATGGGAPAAITLPAGGRYEFVNHNFFGATDQRCMYGCNGVGRAFEFDGVAFVPIRTGMPVDTPNHIAVHKNHLFLSFPGGSLQFSAIGDPLLWAPILGAGELGLGDDCTNLLSEEVGVMVVGALGKIGILYGDDQTTWDLQPLSSDSGIIEWTLLSIGSPAFHDALGLRTLEQTQAFGDFLLGTITHLVETLFGIKKKLAVTPIDAMRVRGKNLYRLFWSDGTGLAVYFGRKQPESAVFNLGRVVRCSCSVDIGGFERLFFGSDDGFVYEMDAGTSFDGEEVEAFARLAFYHLKSPTTNKRYHKATLDLDAAALTEIRAFAEFSDGDVEQPPVTEETFEVRGGGGFWGESNWLEVYWSSRVNGKAAINLDGLGTNISLVVASNATYERPHSIHGVTYHFSYRGLVR